MEEDSRVTFAPRMAQLPPYLFGMINEIRMRKRLEGEDVIDLGMGNPTDPTPEPIIEKLCQVVQDPKSHRYPVAQGFAQPEEGHRRIVPEGLRCRARQRLGGDLHHRFEGRHLAHVPRGGGPGRQRAGAGAGVSGTHLRVGDRRTATSYAYP